MKSKWRNFFSLQKQTQWGNLNLVFIFGSISSLIPGSYSNIKYLSLIFLYDICFQGFALFKIAYKSTCQQTVFCSEKKCFISCYREIEMSIQFKHYHLPVVLCKFLIKIKVNTLSSYININSIHIFPANGVFDNKWIKWKQELSTPFWRSQEFSMKISW